VPRTLAADWSVLGLARGERAEVRLDHADDLLAVERLPRRGYRFRCPRCDRRTGSLYLARGEWACRRCHGLRYPSQCCSAGRRRTAAAIRRRYFPRTLFGSRDAIALAGVERAIGGILTPCVEDHR
jgi:hypothetical protein